MKTGTQIINGVEYVYEDRPYWDPVKKRGSPERNYIGKNVDGVPMYRFSRWSRTHKHPFGKDIPSQRSSEL